MEVSIRRRLALSLIFAAGAALAPDTLAHHLELGFAYLAAGRSREAREAFERGLALPEREKHDATAKERALEALRQLG
jgi:hypothetical protein